MFIFIYYIFLNCSISMKFKGAFILSKIFNYEIFLR